MLTITMNIGVRPHNEHMTPCSVIKYVGTGTKLGSPNLKRRKEPRNSPGFGPKRATSSRPTRPTGQKHVKHSVRGARGDARSMRAACAEHAPRPQAARLVWPPGARARRPRRCEPWRCAATPPEDSARTADEAAGRNGGACAVRYLEGGAQVMWMDGWSLFLFETKKNEGKLKTRRAGSTMSLTGLSSDRRPLRYIWIRIEIILPFKSSGLSFLRDPCFCNMG